MNRKPFTVLQEAEEFAIVCLKENWVTHLRVAEFDPVIPETPDGKVRRIAIKWEVTWWCQ